MGFEYGNLYGTTSAEFLPHPAVKPGEGLNVEVNSDILTLDFADSLEKFFGEWRDEQIQKLKKGKKKEEKNDAAEEEEEEDAADLESLGFSMEALKLDIRYKAMLLGGRPNETDPAKRLIKKWDLVRNKKAVPVSFEELSKFSQPFINKLYEFCTKGVTEITKKNETQSAST